MFANLASIYGSFLWPKDTAPRYATGWGVTAGLCFMCGVLALTMGWLNKKYPYTFDYAKYGIEENNFPDAERQQEKRRSIEEDKHSEERREHI